MIYVMGDIRGCKDKYDDMLEQIKPQELDAVFVLGNVIDHGDDGIAILMDMMYRANIYPILGEREYYAKKFLPVIAEKGDAEKALASLEGENKEQLAKWLTMKSEKTITDFLALSDDDKEALLDYLEEFAAFEEIESKGKRFILTHAGISNHDERDLYEHETEDFVFAETDYGKIYFDDAFLVTGHTPTVAIDKKLFGKPYAKKKHLAIDGGCGLGGKLIAICLDTLTVYYI